MGDHKAPSPPPGAPGYVGPPQVKPDPPPAPPPKRFGEVREPPPHATAHRIEVVLNDGRTIDLTGLTPEAGILLLREHRVALEDIRETRHIFPWRRPAAEPQA